MKVGILGGSFNPPHPGHLRFAQEAKRHLGLDKILLVPAGLPPHKELAAGSPAPSARLALCRLAAMDSPGVEVCDIEIARGGMSYTVDTLEQLKAEGPEDELYLLMGMDMFLSFDKWYKPRRISELAAIVTACREKGDLQNDQAVEAMKRRLKEAFGARVIEIPLDFIEISSSSVRRLLAFGCGDACLDRRVFGYIEENGLYTVGLDRRGLDVDALRKDVYGLLSPKRVPHVEGCEKEAVRLARRWGADVYKAQRAAILHDVTKALKFPEQLILCKRYGIMSDMVENGVPDVKHAVTGALVAEAVYGQPMDICSAIRWHSTGKADMTTLEKIIYLADYIEPNRDFPGVDGLRELAYKDLDECLFAALGLSLLHLENKGKTLAPATWEAYEFLAQGKS